MWHDFKILLRELTTTIHSMQTTETTNAAKAADTLLQTTSTLLLRLQQLDTTIITLPGSGSTDHATIQRGAKQKAIGKNACNNHPPALIDTGSTSDKAERQQHKHKLQNTPISVVVGKISRKVI